MKYFQKKYHNAEKHPEEVPFWLKRDVSHLKRLQTNPKGDLFGNKKNSKKSYSAKKLTLVWEHFATSFVSLAFEEA